MSEALQAALAERARREQQRRQQPRPQAEVPEGMFINPNTGQMTNRDLLTTNAPTGPVRAAGVGALQGMSLGLADEMMGVVGRVEGGPDMANFRREEARAFEDANRRDYPGTVMASEITGAVLSPATKVLGPVKSVKGATATAAGVGAVEGFNRGEGGLQERIKSGAIGGTTSLLFGAALSGASKGVQRGVQRVFNKSVKRPTVGNLQASKNAAYNAAEASGEVFSPDEMSGLFQAVRNNLDAEDFDDIAEPKTAAVLRLLERRQGQEVSLKRLDKIRQTMWRHYKSSKDGEPLILDAISAIDDLIDTKAGASELMGAARAANSRFKKAEMLEDAFNKARLQTNSTGSGGNILNKYRQAVTAIVTNPRKARWFDKEELALMENFIEGDNMENTLRRAGKIAPGGNGLMSALNLYAAAIDPTLLAASATASAAKGAADKTALSRADGLLDAVSTGVIQKPRDTANLRDLAIAAGVTGN